MGLFTVGVPAIKPLIMAEVNIWNMFENPDTGHEAQNNLNRLLGIYSERMQKYHDQKLLATDQQKFSTFDHLNILQAIEKPMVAFEKIDIRVSNFFGVNSTNTPMSDSAFEGVWVERVWGLIGLVALLWLGAVGE